MAEPRSTDKWEQRRSRAIVFTIVSVLLALLVAGILVVAVDRGSDANGGVGGHRWTPEHGGREDRLCLRAASGRSWHEAGDGLGGARGDHGAEEGVSRPDPILNELARIEALRAELRRLRGEV